MNFSNTPTLRQRVFNWIVGIGPGILAFMMACISFFVLAVGVYSAILKDSILLQEMISSTGGLMVVTGFGAAILAMSWGFVLWVWETLLSLFGASGDRDWGRA